MAVDPVGHSTPGKYLNARALVYIFAQRFRYRLRCALDDSKNEPISSWIRGAHTYGTSLRAHPVAVSIVPLAGMGTSAIRRNELLGAADEIVGATRRFGALHPAWFRSLELRQHRTGAASAYCFDIHTRRALATGEAAWSPYRGQVDRYGCVPRQLSGLVPREYHRYVRVLDWKVSCEPAKGAIRRRKQ
jgi:hypothetical protein